MPQEQDEGLFAAAGHGKGFESASGSGSPECAAKDDKTVPKPQSEVSKAGKTSKAKKGNAATRRKRAQRIHTLARFAIQIAFFALAPGLFSSALNGVKYICTQVGALEAIEPTSFVAALIGVCAYTVLFGRFFCGYACAFGAMGDVLFALATPLRRALHIPTLQSFPRLSNCLQFLKIAILVAVCALCFFNAWSVVASWDPWAVFGKVTSGAGWDGIAKKGIAVLILIMVMEALFERSFCRFLCPMGALFSLLPVLPFSSFNRYRPACAKKCNRCQDSCPVDIHPDQGDFHSGECIACGRCAVSCPLKNVNLVFVLEPEGGSLEGASQSKLEALGSDSADGLSAAQAGSSPLVASDTKKKPVAKTAHKRPEPLIQVKGSGIGWVLVKAAVLFAICWLVGVARFVPSPAGLLSLSLPWL